MIVEKFERVIQAAPAIMFDMALKTLSEDLAGSMGKIEKITSAINANYADECQAARALVTAAMDGPLSGVKQSYAGYKTKIENGARQFFSTSKNIEQTEADIAADGGEVKDDSNAVAQCPQIIKDTLLNGSVLDKIGQEFGMDSTHTNLLRGLYGDVYTKYTVNAGETTYETEIIPKCNNSQPDAIIDMINGKTEVRSADLSDVCTQMNANNSILKQTITSLASIYDKVRDDQAAPYSAQDLDFIQWTPLPIFKILETAYYADRGTEIIASLSEMVAYQRVLTMMEILFARMESISYHTASIVSKKIEGQLCELPGMAVIDKYFHGILSKIATDRALLKTQAQSYITTRNELDQMLVRYRQVNKNAVREITSVVGQ